MSGYRVTESKCHTPGSMSFAVLHGLGHTKQFVFTVKAFVLWASGKDEGNTTVAVYGWPVRPT
jgi:hypothetical protein